MTLDQYLSIPGKTASQLAADAGTTGATITRILYGDAQPSAEMVRNIVEATGGMVTAHDLIFGANRPRPERVA
jgi:transcriptional regulator with XRE-family HTH domain